MEPYFKSANEVVNIILSIFRYAGNNINPIMDLGSFIYQMTLKNMDDNELQYKLNQIKEQTTKIFKRRITLSKEDLNSRVNAVVEMVEQAYKYNEKYRKLNDKKLKSVQKSLNTQNEKIKFNGEVYYFYKTLSDDDCLMAIPYNIDDIIFTSNEDKGKIFTPRTQSHGGKKLDLDSYKYENGKWTHDWFGKSFHLSEEPFNMFVTQELLQAIKKMYS